MAISAVVVHSGNQKYLEYCLKSVEANMNVFLLGDKSNSKVIQNWHNLNELDSVYKNRFDQCYKHMSSNPVDFEKMCFYRYIYIYEFMVNNNIEKIIHLDSDVILFEGFHQYIEYVDSGVYEFSCFMPPDQNNYRWTASPHISFWTKDKLKSFIEFFINTYESNIDILHEKYCYHLNIKKPGGICDMTLLYLFCLDNKDKFLNTFICKQFVLDFNISNPEREDIKCSSMHLSYQYKSKNKKVFVSSGGENLPLLSLHCQGKAKKLMYFALNKKLFLVMIGLLSLKIIKKLLRPLR